jgi:tRNA-2-methylthio-N6-dimethylallyladenosine synthase
VVGRSPYLQPVHIEGGLEWVGQILPVRINQTTRGSLSGALADDALSPHGAAASALEPA